MLQGASMMSPWVWIITGTVLIGVGSLSVTYGWSARSSAGNRRTLAEQAAAQRDLQRLAMLAVLQAEAEKNVQVMATRAFTEKDGPNLENRYFFPRVLAQGVGSAIASGLFVPPGDTEMFDALMHLQLSAEQLNARLGAADSVMAGTIMVQGQATRWRQQIRDGQISADFKAALDNLRKQLARYQVDPAIRK